MRLTTEEWQWIFAAPKPLAFGLSLAIEPLQLAPDFAQHLRIVKISSNCKGFNQGVATAVCAGRLHVQHVLHTINLLLDGNATVLMSVFALAPG